MREATIATALHDLTGLPVEVIRKASLGTVSRAWARPDSHSHQVITAEGLEDREALIDVQSRDCILERPADADLVNLGGDTEAEIQRVTGHIRRSVSTAVSVLGENPVTHTEALGSTGFWGQRAAGVLPVAETTGRLLLIQRQFCLESGTWGTIGGAVDADETYLEAALREFVEESGLPAPDLAKSERLYRYYDPESGFRYQNFLISLPEETLPPALDEAGDCGWFHIDDLPAPLHFGVANLFANPASLDRLRAFQPETGMEPGFP